MSEVRGTSRRLVLTGLAGAGLAVGSGLPSPAAAAVAGHRPPEPWPNLRHLPRPARAALEELLAGNRRFRTGHSRHPHQSVHWLQGLAGGQHPFAAFLGCVDSRVPVEIVTDSGGGDLFTARSAGQVLDRAVVGSLEFGVAELGVPLIVVLGHESCGAVKAAIAAVDAHEHAEGSIDYLVEELRPAVEATRSIKDPKARVDAAVRWQARATAERLVHHSEIVRSAVDDGKLGVVAARYDLDTLALTPA